MNLKNILDEVLLVIKRASTKVMEIYNTDFKHELKDDKTPVSAADLASHNLITASLKQFNYPIISEEDKHDTFVNSKDDLFWLLDPLDGTKEFIKKNGEFSINIALIECGRPILGIIALPAHNIFYYAYSGGGSYKEMDGKVHRIFCSTVATKSDATVAVSRSHLSQKDESFLQNNNFGKITKLGSALKYCYLAEGCVDLSVRYSPVMYWDIAAMDILVNESGGIVTDFGKNIINYGLDSGSMLINSGIIVSNAYLENQIILSSLP